MLYIRTRAMQRQFLEKNRCSIDNILDSWVLGDVNIDYIIKSKNGNKPNENDKTKERIGSFLNMTTKERMQTVIKAELSKS
jgi:hypothetical protein